MVNKLLSKIKNHDTYSWIKLGIAPSEIIGQYEAYNCPVHTNDAIFHTGHSLIWATRINESFLSSTELPIDFVNFSPTLFSDNLVVDIKCITLQEKIAKYAIAEHTPLQIFIAPADIISQHNFVKAKHFENYFVSIVKNYCVSAFIYGEYAHCIIGNTKMLTPRNEVLKLFNGDLGYPSTLTLN